jgi:hypothetical protein
MGNEIEIKVTLFIEKISVRTKHGRGRDVFYCMDIVTIL